MCLGCWRYITETKHGCRCEKPRPSMDAKTEIRAAPVATIPIPGGEGGTQGTLTEEGGH